MAQVIFDFKELITNCLHDEKAEFTNAINSEIDSKKFINELFINLKLACQETELRELLKQDHFHFVQNPYIKEKIERLADNPYFELTNLCQIPLSKEFRLYGNLKKVKHTNLYLFRALIVDPNHLIYNEQKFSKLKNLTCLFSKNEECELTLTKKSLRKRKR